MIISIFNFILANEEYITIFCAHFKQIGWVKDELTIIIIFVGLVSIFH
jgi:hypothetical protein